MIMSTQLHISGTTPPHKLSVRKLTQKHRLNLPSEWLKIERTNILKKYSYFTLTKIFSGKTMTVYVNCNTSIPVGYVPPTFLVSVWWGGSGGRGVQPPPPPWMLTHSPDPDPDPLGCRPPAPGQND